MSSLSPKILFQQAIDRSEDFKMHGTGFRSQDARDFLRRIVECTDGLQKSVLFISGDMSETGLAAAVAKGVHSMNSSFGHTHIGQFNRQNGIRFQAHGFGHGFDERLGRTRGYGVWLTPAPGLENMHGPKNVSDVLVLGPDLKPLPIIDLPDDQLLERIALDDLNIPEHVAEPLAIAIRHSQNLSRPVVISYDESTPLGKNLESAFESLSSLNFYRLNQAAGRRDYRPGISLVPTASGQGSFSFVPDVRVEDYSHCTILTVNPDGTLDEDVLDLRAQPEAALSHAMA